MTIFDDDDFGVDDFAFVLGLADEMTKRQLPSPQDNEPLIPDEGAPQWFEED